MKRSSLSLLILIVLMAIAGAIWWPRERARFIRSFAPERTGRH
ncbi:MAG TPA: hypothetical protein VI699_08890 [Candidatus Acidoferrales bacterium]|nr:hypothetical protein [Candidatus Acidoferrales bacterium]